MNEDDERLAVLFAMNTAIQQNNGAPVSALTIFDYLPRRLRERWSAKYLIDYVLRQMIYAGLIRTFQIAPTTFGYLLTYKGRLALRPQFAS